MEFRHFCSGGCFLSPFFYKKKGSRGAGTRRVAMPRPAGRDPVSRREMAARLKKRGMNPPDLPVGIFVSASFTMLCLPQRCCLRQRGQARSHIRQKDGGQARH